MDKGFMIFNTKTIAHSLGDIKLASFLFAVLLLADLDQSVRFFEKNPTNRLTAADTETIKKRNVYAFSQEDLEVLSEINSSLHSGEIKVPWYRQLFLGVRLFNFFEVVQEYGYWDKQAFDKTLHDKLEGQTTKLKVVLFHKWVIRLGMLCMGMMNIFFSNFNPYKNADKKPYSNSTGNPAS
jgi:hypothetical protein